MHTWSENPKQDIFQHLEMLSYSKNCEKLLCGKIKSNRKIMSSKISSIERKKAKEISFCIKQGIEFFKNSEKADISISPLLIYYGMLSFSKAIIISNSSRDLFLDDIKYHGLTTRPINEKQKIQKNKKNNWNLLNEYANVNDGVFLELAKTFNITFDKKDTIKFKDTISTVPELKNLIDKIKIFDSNCIYCYSELKIENEKIAFGIYTTDSNKLEKKNPKINTKYTKQPMHGSSTFTQYISNDNLPLSNFEFFYNYNAVIGGRYFVFPVDIYNNNKKKNILLPQILIDYINFFILSEQVRYHQDNWNLILNGNNDAIVSIIKIYIECVKRRFPNFVLNYLFNESFSYGTPAYLN